MARAMLRGVDQDLSLPARHTRLRLIDMPEICLIAAIVIAVKHFLPFPARKDNSLILQGAVLPFMDWHTWSKLMRPVVESFEKQAPVKVSGDVDGDRLANADDATFDSILALLSSDQSGHRDEGERKRARFKSRRLLTFMAQILRQTCKCSYRGHRKQQFYRSQEDRLLTTRWLSWLRVSRQRA